MRSEEKILFAGRLLELIRELEDMVVDYCRIITANEDGHMLEKDAEGGCHFKTIGPETISEKHPGNA